MTCEVDSSQLTEWIAIGIALLAFVAACWQARVGQKQAALARVHNKISMLPMLVHHVDWDSRPEGLMYSLVVKNVGMGVALINDRHFTYEKLYFSPENPRRVVNELCDKLIGKVIPFQVVRTEMFGEHAKIPPGASFTIARLLFPKSNPNLQEFIEKLVSKASFEVEYESVYKEHFRFSTDD